jgi:hypothetical protein
MKTITQKDQQSVLRASITSVDGASYRLIHSLDSTLRLPNPENEQHLLTCRFYKPLNSKSSRPLIANWSHEDLGQDTWTGVLKIDVEPQSGTAVSHMTTSHSFGRNSWWELIWEICLPERNWDGLRKRLNQCQCLAEDYQVG